VPLRRILAVALVALLPALAACGRARSDTVGPLSIATTVAPITSIVASVVGDRARVDGLIPEGADSHTYEPPPRAAAVLARADIVFVNGLKLEDPVRDLARSNQRAGTEIVELASGTITPAAYIYDSSFPRSAGKPNPHLWTNPPFAKRYAAIVRDTVARRDPANADAYRANYERFAARVDDLDRAMVTASATVPKRELLTYHDAYAYFGVRYGWTIIGAIQVSSFEDPTPREIADLIAQVKRERVPAIFGSEVFPSPVLAQIGREAHVRYVDTLRDDDLPGRPGERVHSWLGLMRADFVTMVTSLGGDASALRAVTIPTTAPDHAVYPQ
jgi:ABC-type Zn uptake system ZnuABC Zn-binding protein ZnuA